MSLDSLRRVLLEEAAAVAALAERLDDSFIKAVDRIIACRGRVITCGIGKSGHIARKTNGTLASTGTPSLFLHAAEAMHGDMSQAMAGVDKDLGNIKVEADAQVLEAVTVSGSKPLMQMGIDRKIFNVEKNITSAGGTGVDVMRNIPSVNVDIDGNVTLRNSAPQIFVDVGTGIYPCS